MPDAAVAAPTRATRADAASSLWTGGVAARGFAFVAVARRRIAPYDPNAQDLLACWSRPRRAHSLGTDQVGRDILSRLIVGTRFTLAIALTSVGRRRRDRRRARAGRRLFRRRRSTASSPAWSTCC